MNEKLQMTYESEIKSGNLKAIKRGNFLDDFGIDVDCYVLNDEERTAVISQRGMSKSLGLSESGSGTALQRFTSGKTISKYIGSELRRNIENPLIFQGFSTGAGFDVVHGYDVTVLIDICKAILAADSNHELTPRYDKVIKQAQVLLTASAKTGIKGLVYALTGYDTIREEVIKSFKLYVASEAQEYEREFPEKLYDEWYRLYDLEPPRRNKPWKFKHLTVKQVYMPLANSDGEILKLLRSLNDDESDITI